MLPPKAITTPFLETRNPRHKDHDPALPVETHSFHATHSEDPLGEAKAFLTQMAEETGTLDHLPTRLRLLSAYFDSENANWLTEDELRFGARLAWRNSIRCVGRMFWPSLQVFDRRDCRSPTEIFEAICAHLKWSTNQGDLRPAITVFRAGHPKIRILNPQLILYAGYLQDDGRVRGDPKNADLTALAESLGWQGKGTQFDVLPVLIQLGDDDVAVFQIPDELILEVPIEHPEHPQLSELGLKWFALPAVSGMVLDLAGVQFCAAPTSGVYQGTEIANLNFSDPKRYNLLPEIADHLELDRSRNNPLWKDHALVEINRAVLHSFKERGVRIMDHHTVSESFRKFCQRESMEGREVHGHWPWIVPPMSSNLSWMWHEPGFKKVILKPGYFYQSLEPL
ncbi:MAG: nitric oxide synthase oxygenase [Pseudomonadota bacterium]